MRLTPAQKEAISFAAEHGYIRRQCGYGDDHIRGEKRQGFFREQTLAHLMRAGMIRPGEHFNTYELTDQGREASQ